MGICSNEVHTVDFSTGELSRAAHVCVCVIMSDREGLLDQVCVTVTMWLLAECFSYSHNES